MMIPDRTFMVIVLINPICIFFLFQNTFIVANLKDCVMRFWIFANITSNIRWYSNTCNKILFKRHFMHATRAKVQIWTSVTSKCCIGIRFVWIEKLLINIKSNRNYKNKLDSTCMSDKANYQYSINPPIKRNLDAKANNNFSKCSRIKPANFIDIV